MMDHVGMRRLTPKQAIKIMGNAVNAQYFNTECAESLLEKVLQI
jgi:hypothetical protein